MRFQLPARRGSQAEPGLKRIAKRVVALSRDLRRPVVAVHDPALAPVLAARLPDARVLALPADAREQHFLLAEHGPVDVLVDLPAPEGRVERFHQAFFHVRAGGAYLVPGGAGELGDRPGPLGTLLRAAQDSTAGRMRVGNRRRRDRLVVALRDHGDFRTDGDDLVLRHRIDDVRAKIREEDLNDYLARVPSPHHVKEIFPAAPPTPEPAGRTGPVQRSPRPTATAAISLRDYRDVVVGPYQVVIDGRIVLPDSYRHHPRPLHSHRRLLDLEPHLAIHRERFVVDDLPRLEGTYFHLDDEFRGHFGHLLTETISRVWAWPHALELDPDVKVIVGKVVKRPEPMPYELDFYEACGIPRDRIVVIDRPVRVDRLISGTPMFAAPHYVHPEIVPVWDQVGARLVEGLPERDWPRRIFISRRAGKRDCLNADELEAVFVEHGFVQVYPEDYPLAEQVQMFQHAEAVAGYAGSGLFQCAFVDRPLHIIRIGPTSYEPRNEQLLTSARGHRLDDVVCQASGTDMHADWSYSEEREGPFLRSLLADLP
ncbi:hypothetical protein GCM10022237_15110 [Nocardioides ginsengisoli]|uniref:Glycosyltransferase 61 family protein n=1 Tax=Nocardioides ginsengisoli TaxID=363868 RepID=A0ABW3VYD8_9ACTN